MLWLRHLHMTLAYLTIAGFATRGLLSFADSRVLQRRWIRVAPHVVDALLLACGVTLAIALRVDPRHQGWLAAKIVALIAYIGFGMVAMRAQYRPLKATAYLAALVSVGYIVAVARTRQVLPY